MKLSWFGHERIAASHGLNGVVAPLSIGGMPLAELKLISLAVGVIALLLLTVLLTGRVPSRRPLRLARVFGQSCLLFSVLLIPIAVWRLPTVYCTMARISVSPETDRLEGNDQFYHTEAERIMSPELLEPLISELSVQNLMGQPFSSIPLSKADAHQLLSSMMRVERIPNARTLAITVFGENRSMVATFANRIGQEYVAQTRSFTPPIAATILSQAAPPVFPVFSNLARNALIGLSVSAVLAATATALWGALNAIKVRVFSAQKRV